MFLQILVKRAPGSTFHFFNCLWHWLPYPWRSKKGKKRLNDSKAISLGTILCFHFNRMSFVSAMLRQYLGKPLMRSAHCPRMVSTQQGCNSGFSLFLVVCDQDKKPHVSRQILKGGNFCQLTSLLLQHNLSITFTNSPENHCCPT